MCGLKCDDCGEETHVEKYGNTHFMVCDSCALIRLIQEGKKDTT